jgi:ribonuclease HI
VLFGVGYHSWLIATKIEKVILRGGGPEDGSPLYMTSYQSELGGICAGLAAIRVLARSSRINLCSVKMVYDNEAAVKSCNQKLTASIYNNTKCDWDLLKTYHTLREEWCQDIPTKVQWVKGHADREGRDLTRDERLNILCCLDIYRKGWHMSTTDFGSIICARIKAETCVSLDSTAQEKGICVSYSGDEEKFLLKINDQAVISIPY